MTDGDATGLGAGVARRVLDAKCNALGRNHVLGPALLDEREANLAETDSRDLFGLSRFLNRKGETGRAHSVCSKAMDAGLPAELRPCATREMALLAKSRGDWQQATQLWQEIVSDPKDGLLACEQLAMHYERRKRDFQRALEYAELGLAKLGRQRRLSRDAYEVARLNLLEEKFVRRTARLRGK